MSELCEAVHPGAVAVTGHDKYAVASASKAAVLINVSVPASTNITDCQTTARGILAMDHLLSIFRHVCYILSYNDL